MKRSLSLLVASTAIILLGQGCLGSSWNGQSTAPVTPSQPAQDNQQAAPPAQPTSDNSTDQQKPTMSLAFPGVLPEAETKTHVRIKTTKGDIVLQILPDQGPNAASNFVYLVKQKFYDGLTFHRRVDGFVIQGGDPAGNGSGGPGYQFADDPVIPVGKNDLLKPLPEDIKQSALSQGTPQSIDFAKRGVLYAKGTLAMANAGANTNGSQFFIMLDDAPLTPDYSIFGKVTEGQDVVDNIQVGDKMTSVTVEP